MHDFRALIVKTPSSEPGFSNYALGKYVSYGASERTSDEEMAKQINGVANMFLDEQHPLRDECTVALMKADPSSSFPTEIIERVTVKQVRDDLLGLLS